MGREGRSEAASAAAGAAGESTARNDLKKQTQLGLFWTVTSYIFKRREKSEN